MDTHMTMGSLLHHATHALSDGRYSLHYTHGWSHVTRPYPTYAPGPSSSHYTSSSPPGHPYPYQHGTPSPPVHALPAQHGIIPSSPHHSTPSPPADGYPHDHGIRPSSSHYATPSPSAHPAHSSGVGDEHTSTSPIRYTSNIYLIAKKRITPIYLTDEVFEHYKRMRATYEAFKKKSEQMSMNRKSEVGEPGTGISLHSAGSICARQHGDTLAELTWRLEEMSTQTPDTSIDEDVVYLEVVPEVKGRVYGLTRQEQMQRDKMECQEENREMQDRLACMEALLMQHLGIRPHVPPTPRTPPSPIIERSGPQSDDQPGHLTTEIAPSQTAHLDDHQLGHWIDPHRRMPKDQRHLLDDHDEFMSQLIPPPQPPPRQ
ncbi:hypothetical protein Syun_009368 [Stephania yunnanensis]|uniref:Uncharacterized protein n=1 Tax=Stephania yunnanensis TaxID=152371 RepID=A0AAP0PQK9_9MAGN